MGFEYDPQRNAPLAKLYHKTEGSPIFSYILAPTGIKLFQEIFTYGKFQDNNITNKKLLQPGDAAPISFYESGDFIHAVQAFPGQEVIFGRSAGSFCQVISRILDSSISQYSKIRLPSGSQRLVDFSAQATLGVVASNQRQKNLIKAGRSR